MSAPPRVTRLAAALLAAAALSCSAGPADGAGPGGDLEVIVSVRNALVVPVGVVWIHLYVPGATLPTTDFWSKGTATATGWTATFKSVSAPSVVVEAAAYTDPRASKGDPNADFLTPAAVPVTIVNKGVATLTLVLQQNVAIHPPATVVTVAPAIVGILASAAELDPTDPGAGVDLAATALDANDPAASLVVAWAAAYAPALPAGTAPGTFTAASALQTRYTPPPTYDGTVTLSLQVTDPLGAATTQAIAVPVSPKTAKGDVSVVVSVNNYPDVTALTTTQGQVAPGATTTLAAAAVDADADALRYQWSAACGGTFGSPNAATTTWTAPPAPGACVVSLTVTDWTAPVAPAAAVARGGTNTARLTVQVMAPTSAFAPQLSYATQAPANPVAGGQAVRFRAVVVQPIGTGTVPVTDLAWGDGLGGAFTPVVAGAMDYVSWVAPSCAAAGTFAYTVTLTATGAGAGGAPPTSAFPFPVTVSCP